MLLLEDRAMSEQRPHEESYSDLELERMMHDGRSYQRELEVRYERGVEGAWIDLKHCAAVRAYKELSRRRTLERVEKYRTLSDEELDEESRVQKPRYDEQAQYCKTIDRWEKRMACQDDLKTEPYVLAEEERKRRKARLDE